MKPTPPPMDLRPLRKPDEPKPAKEAAQEEPGSQKSFSERMFYAPTNARADVAPDALARTAAAPENRARMIPVDWAEIAKVRDQWNNRWRREVIAAR